MARENELTMTLEGTYDAKKAMHILAELYCRQNGYILESITFQSDVNKKSTNEIA